MRKLFTHPLLFKTDRFDNYQWEECHEDCREEKSYKMDFVLQVALHCKE
jgi:DNA repair and recombination protein RAD54B